MSQVDGWYYPAEGGGFTIIGCPRDDCDIRAKAMSFYGPFELVEDDFTVPPLRNPYNDGVRAELTTGLVTLDKIEGLARQHNETGIVQICGEMRGHLHRAIVELD
jgi:hypothetical protein